MTANTERYPRYRTTARYHAHACEKPSDVERSLIQDEINHIRYGLDEGLYPKCVWPAKLAEIAKLEAELEAVN